MLFIGQYALNFDRKGRVTLPSSFVQAIEKQEFKGLYFFPSQCGRYLEAANEAWMLHLSKYLENQGAFDTLDHPKIYSVFDKANAVLLEKAGKITIPQIFLKRFPPRSDITIVGYGYRFAIWRTEDYQAYLRRSEQMFRASRNPETYAETEHPYQETAETGEYAIHAANQTFENASAPAQDSFNEPSLEVEAAPALNAQKDIKTSKASNDDRLSVFSQRLRRKKKASSR